TLKLDEETVEESTEREKTKNKKETKKDAKKDVKKDTKKMTIDEIKKAYPPKVYTKKEMRDKLKGYDRIEKDNWLTIPQGMHIRIFKKDKKFLPGGFVLRKYQDDKKNWHMLLENDKYNRKRPGYRFFPIHLNDVAYIFGKPDPKLKKPEKPDEKPE